MEEGEIESKNVEEVRETPYKLPDGFEWCTIDLTTEKEQKEVRLKGKRIGL